MTKLTKNQIAAAELKAAQQAELSRLRAEKAAKSKATRAANKAALAQMNVQVNAAHRAAADDIAHADIESMFDNLPSPKRVLVGLVLGVAAAGATGYGIGMILSYALAGIAALTGAAWISFTLGVIAWIVAIYSAWKIGGYIGGKVFASVVLPDGLAARSYESVANAAGSAKQNVVGWFGSAKSKAAEQFSGAHTIIKQGIAA